MKWPRHKNHAQQWPFNDHMSQISRKCLYWPHKKVQTCTISTAFVNFIRGENAAMFVRIKDRTDTRTQSPQHFTTVCLTCFPEQLSDKQFPFAAQWISQLATKSEKRMFQVRISARGMRDRACQP